MKATTFYMLIDKQERKGHIVVDRKKVAQLIDVHPNTVKYRLKDGYYEDNKIVICKSDIILSTRGGFFNKKAFKSTF
jgi:hypothetical protein